MRTVLWLLLLFGVAVVAALMLGDNRALASFYWHGWRLDLSLNFFLLLALGVGLFVWAVAKLANSLVSLPEQARAWRNLKRERAVQAALREALAEFFAARYSRSHRAAQKAISVHDEVDALRADREFHRLAHLLAAASLHRLQDRSRRDALLGEVLANPERRLSREAPVEDGARLMAAEWALEDRDSARADALLADLPAGVARRTQALRLKLRAHQLAGRPLEALQTARLLSNHQGFSALAAQGLLRSLACEALDGAHDVEQLRRAWDQMEVADHRDAFVASHAARRAAALGGPELGRQWLRPLWDGLEALEPDARTEVALALLDVLPGTGADWLSRVEAAQRAHPGDPAVQAAAGAVCVENALWGKAAGPLQQAAQDASLQPRARRMAWRLLARIAQQQDDDARAIRCHEQAAAIDG